MNFSKEIQKLLDLSTSKLDNQFKIAILLKEIQVLIQKNGEELENPVAYFAILMNLLQNGDENAEITLYILDKVLPWIPHNICIVKFNSISQLLIEFLNDSSSSMARSIIGGLQTLLALIQIRDLHAKSVFKVVLGLVTDPRPKVRKRAVLAIMELIEKESELTIEFSIQQLKQIEAIDKLHLILQFLKSLFAKNFSISKIKIEGLIQELIKIPKKHVGSMITGKMVFETLEEIIEKISVQGISKEIDSLDSIEIIDSIARNAMDIRPFYNDITLIPSYLQLIGNILIKYAQVLKMQDNSEYYKILSQFVSKFFLQNFNSAFDAKYSTKNAIKQITASVLGNLIIHAVSTPMVKEGLEGLKSSELEIILKTIHNSLGSLHCRESWGYILMICQSVFVRLGVEAPDICQGLLVKLFGFRDDNQYKDFPFKDQLEACIISAIQNLGIDCVLSTIPLNIEQEIQGEATRPYLLATLEKALKGSQLESPWVPFSFFGKHSLKFFYENLFQLSRKLFEKSEALALEGKELESKLYETLGLQAMNLMPLIAKTRPLDFEVGLGMLVPALGHILQSDPKMLYPNLPSHPDFRPLACDTLQKLIKGYVELVEELGEEETDELNHAANGILKVKEYTNQFLSTLCNLFTTVPAEILENPTKGVALQNLHESQTQYIEKTISVFLGIAEKKDIKTYFTSMLDLLGNTQARLHSLTSSETALSPEKQLEKLRSYAVLELLLLLLAHLPSDDASPFEAYFQLIVSLLQEKDSTLQKKAYKSLATLLDYIPLDRNALNGLSSKLLDANVITSVTAGSKKARILCITRLTEKVNSSESDWLLQWIPLCLSEVMLATKEASEKARHAAYECLVAMGQKMMEIKLDNLSKDSDQLMNALENDDKITEENDLLPHSISSANGITEFFTMVSAGLAGSTPHLQSAAIGSLSRLFFEFHTFLEESFVESIIQAICAMLTNKSREVLKSLLGFIKVLIASVSQPILKTYLKDIVGGIMNHAKNEKSHFKSKIRHILERLIRKFGYSNIEEFIPEADQKLITNIKKRKERLKKKKIEKSTEGGEDESDEEVSPKTLSNKTFEDTMYNSDSDIESEKDEKYIPDRFKDETKARTTTAATLLEDQDEVLDFLDSSKLSSKISSVSAKNPKKRSRQEDFTTDEFGRLVLCEPDEQEDPPPKESEDYYKQSLTGEGSFIRTPGGRIKFLEKGNKKAKTEEFAKSGTDWRKKNHSKKIITKSSQKLGEKYASKKAGGDVKRKGMADPHAYIPLSGKIVGNKKKTSVFKNEFKKLLKSSHKSKK